MPNLTAKTDGVGRSGRGPSGRAEGQTRGREIRGLADSSRVPKLPTHVDHFSIQKPLRVSDTGRKLNTISTYLDTLCSSESPSHFTC